MHKTTRWNAPAAAVLALLGCSKEPAPPPAPAAAAPVAATPVPQGAAPASAVAPAASAPPGTFPMQGTTSAGNPDAQGTKADPAK